MFFRFFAPLWLFVAPCGFLAGLLPSLLTPLAQSSPGLLQTLSSRLVGLPESVGCLTPPREPRYDYGQSPNRQHQALKTPSHGSSFSSSRLFSSSIPS